MFHCVLVILHIEFSLIAKQYAVKLHYQTQQDWEKREILGYINGIQDMRVQDTEVQL